MAHLLYSLKDYFVIDDINIDSWTFKLYYRFSCALCMLGAMVGMASQYFGNPIRFTEHCQNNFCQDLFVCFSCEFQGISLDVAEDYCWIHGSTFIPREYQSHLKCIVEQEYFQDSDDAPDTAYYQWVSFFMVLQVNIVNTYLTILEKIF